MENKNQNGAKPVYEPVRVQVQKINPTGVLCASSASDPVYGLTQQQYTDGGTL